MAITHFVLDDASECRTSTAHQEKIYNGSLTLIDDSVTEVSSTVVQQDLASALEKFVANNELDPNLPQDLIKRARQFLQDQNNDNIDPEASRSIIHDFKEHSDLAKNHSAYAEIRAVVDATDEPALPVATFRVLLMGTVFCIAGSAIQQFFSLRMPSISVSTYVVQLLSMPLGLLMAKYLPKRTLGSGKCSFTMNPGAFSQKEHLLIAMMANVSFGGHSTGAYVTSIIQVLKLKLFYGEETLANSIPWQICTLLATQLMGYGCAGMTRRFLVYPPAMIWQRPLSNIALTKALHRDQGQDSKAAVDGWTISRYRFFILCFCGMFIYYWFPNYLFEALALFNWITWIAPKNVKLAIITGSTCGLGLNPLPTLDWNIAAYLHDPIITPLFTLLNLAAGMAVAGFLVTPILHFNNVWNGGYLPINTNKIFDNSGEIYSVHRILHANMTLNEEAYRSYSIPWFSTTQVVSYVGVFTMYASIPVYTFLHFRRDIISGVKSLFCKKTRVEQFDDIQNRLMSAYPECPHWWYFVTLCFSFALACISVTLWPTEMPIWGIVLALLFTVILQVPVGMLWAITNVEIPTSILATAFGGYVLEGKAIPNMIFKMFSFMTTSQSLNFVADLKLAHYAKIPPRWAFVAQVYATVLSGFVALGVNHWVLRNIPDICAAGQSERFTCPGAWSFFKASVVWGVIGPRRLFGSGGPYISLVYCVPIGVILPVIVYLGMKRWPTCWFRNINVPILLAGPLCWAPYNWAYMQGNLMLALFFNYLIKRRYNMWWERYAYVLSSSFMAAIGIAGLIMFFSLQQWDLRPEWWGNRVHKQGVDMAGVKDELGKIVKCVYLQLPQGGALEPGF